MSWQSSSVGDELAPTVNFLESECGESRKARTSKICNYRRSQPSQPTNVCSTLEILPAT